MLSVEPGVVVWITGLSGVGKSTVANEVVRLLRDREANVVLLDGDSVRAIMGDDLGHDSDGRLRNAYRLARLAAMLSQQGAHVVCATMSLFPEVWAWNRAHLPRYFEVYLRAPLPFIESRDIKGIYARARRGGEQGVVGVDLPFVEPIQPHLVIDNDTPRERFDDVAERIVVASGVLSSRMSGRVESGTGAQV